MGRETSTELTLSIPSPTDVEAISGKGTVEAGPSGTAAITPKTATSSVLAPGFRFHPTDEELVGYYLKRKVTKKPIRFNAIAEVDIYKVEPWELAGKSRFKTRDQEWYFFCALDKKYGSGARLNRATEKGYWKATGKDREVCYDSQVNAMKKTLVYHTGRAPDGKRTNWVMHEYRLIDEELERIGASQVDDYVGYVLCRVFHKNNIGPPNANRYAPFVEEEWDDGEKALVLGLDAADDGVAGDDAYVDRNEFQQDCNAMDKDPLGHNELVIGSQLQRKRKHNDSDPNHSNGSDNSTGPGPGPAQDGSSSTSSPNAATATVMSAMMEFSLRGSMEPNEGPRFHTPLFDVKIDTSMPPRYMKLINELQVEKESLKLQMSNAQSMINSLCSRIDSLSKENEDLKQRNTLSLMGPRP